MKYLLASALLATALTANSVRAEDCYATNDFATISKCLEAHSEADKAANQGEPKSPAVGGKIIPNAKIPFNSAKVIKEAEAKVVVNFKDPDSAKFRNVHVIAKDLDNKGKKSRSYAVCGEVNAKNGFGAYVGFVAFSALIGTDNSVGAAMTVQSPVGPVLYKVGCVDDGGT